MPVAVEGPSYLEHNRVVFQWLEHRWLIYYDYFELVHESDGKNPIAADISIFGIILGVFLYFILIMVCYVYSLESP